MTSSFRASLVHCAPPRHRGGRSRSHALRLLGGACLTAVAAGSAFASPPSDSSHRLAAPAIYEMPDQAEHIARVPQEDVSGAISWVHTAISQADLGFVSSPPVADPTNNRTQTQTQNPTQARPQNQTETASEDDAQPAAGLKSVRAQALLGLGQIAEARAIASDILKERPDDIAALTVMAAADEAEGKWRHAAQYWTQIYSMNANPAAAARRDALKAAHPTEISAVAFFEGSSGVDEQYGLRATGAWRPIDGPEWTAVLETRQAEAAQVVRLDGGVRSVSLNRQRIDIGVADTTSFGRFSFNATAAQNGAGVRASYGGAAQWGKFEITAAFNEPYWLYSAGISNEAKTDYVGASAAYYSTWLGARIAVRQSNYGVADDKSIARSTRATAGLDASLSDQPDAWRLSYVLDGEYFDRIDQRSGSGGAQYAPMPFVTREVHSFGVYKDFGDKSNNFVTLGGGYREDRYGSNGVFASVSGEVAPTRDVRIGARMEYSDTSIRGLSENSYSFGEVYVRRIF